HHCFGEEPARDARLIADQHDREFCAIECLNRCNRPGKQLDALRTIEIADFFDDGAVAVEKDRLVERFCHSVFGFTGGRLSRIPAAWSSLSSPTPAFRQLHMQRSPSLASGPLC